MKFVLFLALITVLDIGALVSARYYIEKQERKFMVISLIFFGLSAWVYVQLMGFEVTAIINMLYAAISTIFVTLFYYLVFKERITTGQWLGLGIVLIGILMLEI